MQNEESPPHRLTPKEIFSAINFANSVYESDLERFDKAKKILLTHLSLHDNITETVESIIIEYSLDYDTRMLFIGLAEIIKNYDQEKQS